MLHAPPEEIGWMVQQIKPGKNGVELQFVSKEFAMKLLNDMKTEKGTGFSIPDQLVLNIRKDKD